MNQHRVFENKAGVRPTTLDWFVAVFNGEMQLCCVMPNGCTSVVFTVSEFGLGRMVEGVLHTSGLQLTKTRRIRIEANEEA